MPQGFVETAGVHLHRPAAALALEVVVVVARLAADEPHHLVGAEDALGPAFADEAFEVPVDRGKAGAALGHALPDLLHRERPVGIPQHLEDAFPLRRLPHACGTEGGGW